MIHWRRRKFLQCYLESIPYIYIQESKIILSFEIFIFVSIKGRNTFRLIGPKRPKNDFLPLKLSRRPLHSLYPRKWSLSKSLFVVVHTLSQTIECLVNHPFDEVKNAYLSPHNWQCFESQLFLLSKHHFSFMKSQFSTNTRAILILDRDGVTELL